MGDRGIFAEPWRCAAVKERLWSVNFRIGDARGCRRWEGGILVQRVCGVPGWCTFTGKNKARGGLTKTFMVKKPPSGKS